MDGAAEPHLRGVMPRAFDQIFNFIESGRSEKSQFLVRPACGPRQRGSLNPGKLCSLLVFEAEGVTYRPCKDAGAGFVP